MSACIAGAGSSGPRGFQARRVAAGWVLAVVAGAGAVSLVSPAAAQMTAAPLARAEVLDVMVLPAQLPGGHKLREVSGLAWDRAAHHLISVSDRGLLVRWMLDIDRRRLVSAWPVQARVLSPRSRLNAESVEVLPGAAGEGLSGARLLVMDEKRNHMLMVDAQGMPSGTMQPPAALQGAVDGEGKGVEAIAWHAAHGALAARQWPAPADSAAGLHRIHATDGRSWVLRATPGARSSIKAMHLLDEGRLLLLEKLSDGEQRQVLLREVDLRGCTNSTPCNPASVAIDRGRFQPEDNFEGLACMDTDLCLIVSDDGKLAQSRTVLALILLARERRAVSP